MSVDQNGISSSSSRRVKRKSVYSYLRSFLFLSLEILGLIIIDVLKKVVNVFIKSKEKIITGQVALITGGGNGLGKEIAIELAKKGCKIVVADIDVKAAEEVAKNLEDCYKVKSKAYKLDVSNYNDVQEISKRIENDIGAVDILVNNAGLMPVAPINQITPSEVDKVIGVNLTAHFWTTQTFIKEMRKKNQGHIVAICSVAGLSPVASGILYSTTKYGVRGFMESLTSELILEKSNIKTTTVFPYFIETNKILMDALVEMNSFNFLPPMSPTNVARQIVQAIVTDKENVIIPNSFGRLLFLGNLIPKYILMPKVYQNTKLKVLRISEDKE